MGSVKAVKSDSLRVSKWAELKVAGRVPWNGKVMVVRWVQLKAGLWAELKVGVKAV